MSREEVENGIHRCNTTDIKAGNEYFKDTTFKDNIEPGISHDSVQKFISIQTFETHRRLKPFSEQESFIFSMTNKIQYECITDNYRYSSHKCTFFWCEIPLFLSHTYHTFKHSERLCDKITDYCMLLHTVNALYLRLGVFKPCWNVAKHLIEGYHLFKTVFLKNNHIDWERMALGTPKLWVWWPENRR